MLYQVEKNTAERVVISCLSGHSRLLVSMGFRGSRKSLAAVLPWLSPHSNMITQWYEPVRTLGSHSSCLVGAGSNELLTSTSAVTAERPNVSLVESWERRLHQNLNAQMPNQDFYKQDEWALCHTHKKKPQNLRFHNNRHLKYPWILSR